MFSKIIIYVALFTSFFVTSYSQAALIKDGVWKVEANETLENILQQTLKGQPLRQKRLSRLIPKLSPNAFDTNDNLIAGQTIRIPGAKLPKHFKKNTQSTYAGRILASTGKIYVQTSDDNIRLLSQGEHIKAGDTVKTTNTSKAQIRFTDGSLVALRTNTEFTIEEYHFNGLQDGSEKGVYKLIKGGLRTLSGLIGKRNKDNYQLKTPVAVIGIRGTDYSVTYCSGGNCGDLNDGLYCGVADGEIITTNNAGSWNYGNDDYFFIETADSSSKELLTDPGIIFGNKHTKKSKLEKQVDTANESSNKELSKYSKDLDLPIPIIKHTPKPKPNNTAAEGTKMAVAFRWNNGNLATSNRIFTQKNGMSSIKITEGSNPPTPQKIHYKVGDKNRTINFNGSVNNESTDNTIDKLGLYWGMIPSGVTINLGENNEKIVTQNFYYGLAKPDHIVNNLTTLKQNPSSTLTLKNEFIYATDLSDNSGFIISQQGSLTLNLLDGTFSLNNLNLNNSTTKNNYSLAIDSASITSALAGNGINLNGTCSSNGQGSCEIRATLNGTASFIFAKDASKTGAIMTFNAKGKDQYNKDVGVIGVGGYSN